MLSVEGMKKKMIHSEVKKRYVVLIERDSGCSTHYFRAAVAKEKLVAEGQRQYYTRWAYCRADQVYFSEHFS